MHESEGHAAKRLRVVARSGLSSIPEGRAESPRPPANPFSVRLLAAHEHDADTAVLGVYGEIDLETAPIFRDALAPVLQAASGSVVIDLSEVTFMDSTGVHVLLETLQRLEAQNRQLAVVCANGGQVHRILALVGLLDAVAVHGSRRSALSGGNDRLRREPDGNRKPTAAPSQGPSAIGPASGRATQAGDAQGPRPSRPVPRPRQIVRLGRDDQPLSQPTDPLAGLRLIGRAEHASAYARGQLRSRRRHQ